MASLVPAEMEVREEGYDTITPDAPSRATTLLPAAFHPPPPAPVPPDEVERTVIPATPPGKTEMPNGRPTQPLAAGIHDTPTILPGDSAALAASGSFQVLPGYEILGVLGRGGMGVVYKARQNGLNRVVALKMIISGPHASDEELNRFKTEAEAVAALKHPNIVQIHDMGVRDGRPFFSLEFCEGGSLQSRLDGTPMPPTAAARLMRTLADAVAHAHSENIIHRDLKPANILLMEGQDHPLERCTPKITDFGLAKRLGADDQGQTATEAILGTPTYMAPEQAQGKTRQAGPSADVYALGAILYDLLTGRPPFKGASALDTIQMVQTAEPVPPMRLQPGVPGDLQTITLKCLEKDPKRRYATAIELAADLSRFLEGKPIHARPVSAAERAWKFARRNPLWVTIGLLVFLAPSALLGMSVVHSRQLKKERDNVIEQEKKTGVERDRAVEAEQAAKKAEEKALEEKGKADAARDQADKARAAAVAAEAKAQESFLEVQQAVEQLVRLSEARLRYMAGTDKVRDALLSDALRLSEKLTVRRSDSTAARVREAHGHRLVGDIREKQGKYDLALGHFEKSVQLLDEVLVPTSAAYMRVDWQSDAVEGVLLRWKVLEATNNPKADGTLDAALARLDRLPEGVRGNWLTRWTRAKVLTNRAIHHEHRSAPAKAIKDLDDAIGILEALTQDGELQKLPGRLEEVKQELARVRTNRAAIKVRGAASAGRHDAAELREQAEADAREAIDLLEHVSSERARDPETLKELGRAITTRGLVLSARGEHAEAAALAGQAVTRFRAASQDAPENVDLRQLLALALSDRGLYLVQAGRYATARLDLEEARGLLARLADEVPTAAVFRKDLARADNTLGLSLLVQNRYPEALERLEEARAGFRRAGDAGSARGVWASLVSCRDRLAHDRLKAGDRRAALAHLVALADLRRDRLEEVPKSGDAWALLERIAVGSDLLFTLQARARVLDDARDYPALPGVIAEMQTLAGRSWPAHVEHLPALARAMAADPAHARAYGEKALSLLKGQKRTAALEAFLAGPDLAPVRAMPGYRAVLGSLPR